MKKIDQSMYELVGKFIAETPRDMDSEEIFFLFAIEKSDNDDSERPYVVNAGRIDYDFGFLGLAASSKAEYFKIFPPTDRRKRIVIRNLFIE